MEAPDLVVHAATRFPDRACVIGEDQALTFAEVDERAARLTSVIRGHGLGEGGRVAVLAYNEVEFTEIRVAAQRAGALLVPLNYRLSAPELAAIIEDCEPGLLIVGPGLDDLGGPLPVPVKLWLGTESYESAMAEAVPAPRGRLDAGRAAMIGYTSGTTGRPKGAVLSNGALHAAMIAMGQEIGARPGATYLAAMPMFHIGSLVGFAFTYLGGTCRQLRRFDTDAVVRLLASGTVTHAQLVPVMIRAVVDAWPRGTRCGLERMLYGAAPMPPELAHRTLRTLGCELVNGYGSTEAMGISMLSPEEHDLERAPHLLASVGRSGIGMRVCVVDQSGAECAPGRIGEIVCSGASVMSGYWKDPRATAEALRGGRLHTGDLGYRDDDGYLYLVDRRHDKIVTGGENVYPTEVENILLAHPGIRDAAVVGIPDARWGEAVCAAIVADPGTEPDPAEVIAFCRGRLAGYKVPKRILLVGDLPKSPTGKLLRRQVRATWPH